jgi:hypothetical protein
VSALHSIEALKNTFRDLKDYAPTSFFVAGILCLPLLINGVVQAVVPLNPVVFATWITLALLGFFFSSVALPVAIIRGTYDYATGQDPGVGRLLAKTFRAGLLFKFLGFLVLLFLILLGLMVAIAIPIGGTILAIVAGADGDFDRAFGGPAVLILVMMLILGIVTFIILSVYIYVRFAVAGMAVVLEGSGPATALRRSSGLTKGHRWDASLAWLILAGVGTVIALVIFGPAFVVSFATMAETANRPIMFAPGGITGPPGFGGTPGVAGLVVAVSTYLITVIAGVINNGLWTNFYLGLRGEELLAAPSAPSPGGYPAATPGPHGEADADEEQERAGEDQDPGDLGEQEGRDDG